MSQASAFPPDHPSSSQQGAWRPALAESEPGAVLSDDAEDGSETPLLHLPDQTQIPIIEQDEVAPPVAHSDAHEVSRPGVEHGAPRPSLRAVYAEALESAIALAYADGGELATLSNDGQRMIVRVHYQRDHRARSLPAASGNALAGAKGTPSRPSQPTWMQQMQQAGLPNPPSRPGMAGMVFAASQPGSADDFTELDQQSTQALPAAQMRPPERSFRLGEGFIGLAWREGHPLVMHGENYRQAQHEAAAIDEPDWLDAAWRIAVPIFRPGSLSASLASRPPTDLMGVLSLYRNDPARHFTQRELEVLPLHADRIARALRQAETAHHYQSQVELLEAFHDIGVNFRQLSDFYARLRDIVRHLVAAPTFGVLLDQRNDVSLEFAERDGQPVPMQLVSAVKNLPWWQMIEQGRVAILPGAHHAPSGEAQQEGARSKRITRPASHSQSAQQAYQSYMDGPILLGWGGDLPVGSLLAAPLMIGHNRIGALVVASPLRGVYSRERAHIFETLAKATALVIENARLSGEMQRTIDQSRASAHLLSMMSNALLTLNASLDVNRTLEHLADQAALLTRAEVCLVFLLDEKQQAWIGQTTNMEARKQGIEVKGVRIPVSWRGLDDAFTVEAFHLMDDLTEEWDDQSEVGNLLRRQRIESCLAFPIASQERVIGAMFVFTPGMRYHFQPNEIGPLQALVSQGATAINNALLYQELQQAYDNLKALDRLKDEFILTVSHEFRTPLTAIEGYVTLINKHGHRLDQAKLSQFAEEIHHATLQLAGMISMLADANRMNNQPLPVTLRPVNLREMATQAVATQSPEAKERVQNAIPNLEVIADDERLRLIFTNLISNALKYSPEQSPCFLTAEVVSRNELLSQGRTLGNQTAERWVVTTVRDQGPGISSEDQAKLFQKFVRLTHSLTTSVRGTGLGLWICRQYVTAMGGDIWVESAIQRGSRFSFCLPLAGTSSGGV